jgi:hypothetical protein
MIKILTKFSLLLISTLVLIIIYLSSIGINTNKFNQKIKNQISNLNPKIELDLKDIKFLLNPFSFSVSIKTTGTSVKIGNEKIELEFIKFNLLLKSIINKNFLIDDLKLSTKLIKLKDIVSISRSLEDTVELFLISKVIKEGSLMADINLRFDENGNFKDDYKIKGFIKNAKLKFLENNTFENLDFLFNIENKEYNLGDIQGKFNDVNILPSVIKIQKKDNYFHVDGKLLSEEKNINVNLLNQKFNNFFKDRNIRQIILSSSNNFSFLINKKFKIKDLIIKSDITLNKLVYIVKSPAIKKYFNNLKEKIELIDHRISLIYKKDFFDITGKGKLSFEDISDKLSYKITKQKDTSKIKLNINFDKNQIHLNSLAYIKKRNSNSNLIIDGIYKKNDSFLIKELSFKENKNSFLVKDLNLNKNLKFSAVKSIKLNYINEHEIHNKISINKNKKDYQIQGESFDISKLIDELSNDDSKSSISNNFNSKINIDILKTYLDKKPFVNNVKGNLNFRDNKINALKLESLFLNKKKLKLTINTNNQDEKITILSTDYPKPLVNRYDFIKGFEEGNLYFYSIKKNNLSKSVLKIDNFKVQEVPVLAKLLTLASLQGIADILTGEGIRFSNMEMKFSNKKGLMTIDELYAIGPAISILMEGYIESKKLISLRGTLVPATTINKKISSIPLLGEILVGKKVGEGVFGVSFKIKGAPKNLKTTVNPVKTLTPRFITRTLEKIKKD